MNTACNSTQQPITGVVNEIGFFKPSHYAIGLIQRAVANRQNIVISGGITGKLYVFPELGEYISMITNDSEFFTLPAKMLLEVSVLTTDEVRELREETGNGRNIDELMWIATHYASKGRLMAGCSKEDVIHLKHWPNLTRLPYRANTLRLASLFSKIPVSIKAAQQILGVSHREINDFYSAAHAAGLVETTNAQSMITPEQLKPHKERTLLEKIISRISNI